MRATATYRYHPSVFRFQGEEAWVCGPCRKVFRKKANLACHMFKVHARQSDVRFYLTGAVCIGCGKDFVTWPTVPRVGKRSDEAELLLRGLVLAVEFGGSDDRNAPYYIPLCLLSLASSPPQSTASHHPQIAETT